MPTRLHIYQRLINAESRDEVKEIGDELRDRFGPLPQPAAHILYVACLRVLAYETGVETAVWSDGEIILTLSKPVGSAQLALEKALGPRCRVGNYQIHVHFHSTSEGWQQELVLILERLLEFRVRTTAVR